MRLGLGLEGFGILGAIVFKSVNVPRKSVTYFVLLIDQKQNHLLAPNTGVWWETYSNYNHIGLAKGTKSKGTVSNLTRVTYIIKSL